MIPSQPGHLIFSSGVALSPSTPGDFEYCASRYNRRTFSRDGGSTLDQLICRLLCVGSAASPATVASPGAAMPEQTTSTSLSKEGTSFERRIMSSAKRRNAPWPRLAFSFRWDATAWSRVRRYALHRRPEIARPVGRPGCPAPSPYGSFHSSLRCGGFAWGGHQRSLGSLSCPRGSSAYRTAARWSQSKSTRAFRPSLGSNAKPDRTGNRMANRWFQGVSGAGVRDEHRC